MYAPPYDPTGVTGRRIGAWLLDFVFAGVLTIIAINLAVDGVRDIPGNLCRDESVSTQDTSTMCRATFLGQDGWAVFDENANTSTFFESDGLWVPPAVFIGYGLFSFVVVEGLVGGSIGKMILGLRVVKADGTHAGLGRSLVRFLLWIVDGIPYCFPLVGLIAGLSTRGHRRLGDMAAGTFVVGTRDVGAPLSIPGLTPPAPYVPAPTAGTFAAAGSEPMPYGPTPYGTQPYAAPPTPGAPAPYGTPSYGSPAPVPPTDFGSTAAPGAPADTSTAATEPQWDPQRNTHIQWDPARNCWLQWDQAAQEWQPIE